MDKTQKKRVEKIIYAGFRWKFVLVILGVIAVAWFIVQVTSNCVTSEMDRCTLNGVLTVYYELLIAVSAIVTATVVLFYTMIDNRRMGIANRMVISYYAGRYALPCCFMLTLIGLPVIQILLDINREYIAEAGIVIIFTVQLGLIALILVATSFRCNIYFICKIEKSQLNLMLEDGMEDEFLWMYMVHHMEGIAAAEGIFLEKSQLIYKLLKVPLETGDWKERQETKRWKKVIYKYYYMNLEGLFRQVREDQGLEKIYAVLYEFAGEIAGDNLGVNQQTRLLINSAILNAALYSGVAEKSGFCACFINQYVDNQIRNGQIVLFYLFHDLLYRTGHDNINREVVQSLKSVGDLGNTVKNMRGSCLEFWEIWCEQYGMSRQIKVAGFYNAMLTLEGEYGKSYSILYIKNLLHKRGEYIDCSENTAEK